MAKCPSLLSAQSLIEILTTDKSLRVRLNSGSLHFPKAQLPRKSWRQNISDIVQRNKPRKGRGSHGGCSQGRIPRNKGGPPKGPGLTALPNDSHHVSLQWFPSTERLTSLPNVTQLVGGLVRAQTHPIPKPRLPPQCRAHARPPLGKHLQMPSLAHTAELAGSSTRSSRIWVLFPSKLLT